MKNCRIRRIHNIILSVLLICMICPIIKVQAKSTETDSTKVVVIDPSGQETANTRKEPIGPGSFKTVEGKSGIVGSETGCADYEINLQIALKLKDILNDQGYTVVLTRDSNGVNMNGGDRAMVANLSDADAFVVISGCETSGTTVVCQSNDNSYTYGNYENSRLLADAILGSVVQSTSSANNGVVESNNNPKINWCMVPTSIVEIGTLSNADDEEKLISEDYQQDIATGIANGINSYFSQK